MFGDFYLQAFYSPFSHCLSVQTMFPLFESAIKNEIVSSNDINPQRQSYTTKQTCVKQEVINGTKQKDLPQERKESLKKAQKTTKKQNKSIFHNYQKHLITTLKQKISLELILNNQVTNKCVRQLWQGFMKSKIANRTLLLSIFGEEGMRNVELSYCLSKCGLEWIQDKYSIEEIKQAQSRIRKIVIEYFKNRNLDEELAGRKFAEQQKHVFKHYINFFLNQLASGTLNKRLPKSYKRQIIE